MIWFISKRKAITSINTLCIKILAAFLFRKYRRNFLYRSIPFFLPSCMIPTHVSTTPVLVLICLVEISHLEVQRYSDFTFLKIPNTVATLHFSGN